MSVESCEVAFRVARPLVSEEGLDVVLEFTGEITDEDDEVEDPKAGAIHGYVVKIGQALENGVHLSEACDALDQSLFDYSSAFIDFGKREIRQGLAPESMQFDLLIVDTITVRPAYRGGRLGQFAMLSTIDVMGAGCAGVGIKPFPLQFSPPPRRALADPDASDGDLATFSIPERAATEKLRRYWSELGFSRVKKSPYFFLDLAFKRPLVRDLLQKQHRPKLEVVKRTR